MKKIFSFASFVSVLVLFQLFSISISDSMALPGTDNQAQVGLRDDDDIGTGYTRQQDITGIYVGRSLVDGENFYFVRSPEKRYLYSLLHFLILECQGYLEDYNQTMVLRSGPIAVQFHPILEIGTVRARFSESPSGSIEEVLAKYEGYAEARQDAREFVSRYSCGSPESDRLYHNLKAQFPRLGPDPLLDTRAVTGTTIEPKIEETKNGIYYNYGSVWDDFVPDSSALALDALDEPRMVAVTMEKSGPRALTDIAFYPAPHWAIDWWERDDSDHSDEQKALIREDFNTLKAARARVLKCFYRSEQSPSIGRELFFWFEHRPKQASHDRLIARAPKHPLLQIDERAFTICPISYAVALGEAPGKESVGEGRSLQESCVNVYMAKSKATPAQRAEFCGCLISSLTEANPSAKDMRLMAQDFSSDNLHMMQKKYPVFLRRSGRCYR